MDTEDLVLRAPRGHAEQPPAPLLASPTVLILQFPNADVVGQVAQTEFHWLAISVACNEEDCIDPYLRF